MSAPDRILHYPGSKWRMAKWIISHFPPHMTYLEPFFGSGAVFFNKPRSSLETINDLDKDVTNLFEIIRTRREELAELIRWTPYARDEYYKSYEPTNDNLERARRFMVRRWMAIGFKSSDRTGWRSVRDAKGHLPSKLWTETPERFLEVSKRLQGVQIESKPALELIERYNRSDVLIYADPPYVIQTRSGRIYRHEMNDQDHVDLLEALDRHPGPVILSGYEHPIYDDFLTGWVRESKQVAAEAGASRKEILWINPIAAGVVGQQVMF